MNAYSRAMDTAIQWHRTQTRKGRLHEPFVHHPFRVARTLIRQGLTDNDLLCAAVLHDVLEDTKCPPAEIEDSFGSDVLSVIQEVTDDKHLLKSERKQRQVERADLLSLKARLIRIADKTDNVGSLLEDPPASWSVRRQRDYVAWARRVVNRIRGTHPGLEREFDDVAAQAWAALTGVPSGPPPA